MLTEISPERPFVSNELKVIHLKELSTSPSTDQAFAEMLDRCSTSSTIDLLGRQLGDRTLELVAKQCKLIVLCLCENGPTGLGAGYLAEMLKTNHHLTALGLEVNATGDIDVEQLNKGLEENHEFVSSSIDRSSRL